MNLLLIEKSMILLIIENVLIQLKPAVRIGATLL